MLTVDHPNHRSKNKNIELHKFVETEVCWCHRRKSHACSNVRLKCAHHSNTIVNTYSTFVHTHWTLQAIGQQWPTQWHRRSQQPSLNPWLFALHLLQHSLNIKNCVQSLANVFVCFIILRMKIIRHILFVRIFEEFHWRMFAITSQRYLFSMMRGYYTCFLMFMLWFCYLSCTNSDEYKYKPNL